MGGFVAQWVVAAAPERVSRLVIMGSATVPGTFAGMDEFAPLVSALADPVPTDFIRGFQESTLHVPVPHRFLEEVITESAKLPAHVWKGVMDELMTAPAPGGLAKHRIPTLILWGEKDAYAPRAQQDALIQQHGTGVLRIYRSTGHAPHWERPEEVAWDLWAFMRLEPAPAR
jgi:rifampin ADP-ribosylating transferase